MPVRPEPQPVREQAGAAAQALPEDVLTGHEPVVLRGLVAHWPLVGAARQSAGGAIAYLRGHLHPQPHDATVGAWIGAPEIQGRFFYNAGLDGFNFQARHLRLADVLNLLDQHHADPAAPSLYVGSTTVDTCLPGLREHNDLPLGGRDALASIWLGNRTRVAAHHDLPDNLACVVAGRRRFTLFPPDAVGDLYVGPLDFTPAGQAVSLVDVEQPDLAAFPRYAQALARAQVAELEPGDAIFIPSLWWHAVSALDGFNGLVNYWWRQSPAHMDTPMHALLMAMLSVRDLPPVQRQAWRQLFDHYVFEAGEHTAAHLPPAARGSLQPLDANAARVLRARLLRGLNR
jgi:Cupin-like domain